MTQKQYEFLQKLAKDLGSDITLGEILERTDLKPEAKPLVPIEKVKFNISGILQYAYECTGEKQSWSGTIIDVLEDLTSWTYFDADEMKKTGTAKMGEILTDKEINDLADFFFGNRYEKHLDYIEARANRKVTKDEVVEYLKRLDVRKDFKYKDTVIEY